MNNMFYIGHLLLLFCSRAGYVTSEQSCDTHDLQTLMVRLRQLKTETESRFKDVTKRINFLETELAERTDGDWSVWGSWSSCSNSCGGGIQSRNRTCSDPAPSTFGKHCLGNSEQISLCNKHQCPDTMAAFTATNIDNSTYGTSGLRFTKVLLNIGSNYNSTYGTFTCSRSGLYHFVVVLTLNHWSSNTASCNLCLNGVNQFNIYMTRYDDNYSSTAAGTFHLKEHDVIHVCSCTDTTYMNKGNTNMFTGFFYQSSLRRRCD